MTPIDIFLAIFSIIPISVGFYYMRDMDTTKEYAQHKTSLAIIMALTIGSFAAFFLHVSAGLFGRVQRIPTLFQAILLITMNVVIFSLIYTYIILSDHGGFSGYDKANPLFSSFYFSVITFSTTGYGDIVPRSKAAKVAVMAQVFISMLTIGFILSRAI